MTEPGTEAGIEPGRDRVTRVRDAGLLLALAAGYVVLFAGAVTGSIGTVVVAALALWVLDVVFVRYADRRAVGALNTASAGITWRVFVRQTLLVVLLLVAGDHGGGLGRGELAVVVAAVLAHHLVLGLYLGVRTVVRVRRLRRLETANLDVPGAQLPPPPSELVFVSGAQLLLRTDLVLVLALAWAWAAGLDDASGLVVAAAIAMVAAALVVPAALLPAAVALLRLPSDETRMRAAQQAVLAAAPRVILYFSGGAADVYQVNMWLTTMERLDRPVLVLLRERRYLDAFGPTSVPVLCLPFTADVMNLDLPTARVGLYVANVGRNIHLLREPGLKSAFIGHGDSDKTASFNPATKVYDEVWVAGEAGRDRYRRAQVGVRDDDVVLVGRPQLDAIASLGDRPVGEPFTVLYAPTWEGWTDDPFQTSVTAMGLPIVRELLATPGVRVVYKPHPLTGRVNRATAAASDQIVAAVTAAGAPHEVLLDNAVPLYDAFNTSDALVSDISSVVSDYLRSAKPYFVCNPGGLPDDAFREQNPSAGAAHLLRPDGDPRRPGGVEGLATGLAAARGEDPLRQRRAAVRTYLIGDPSQDSLTLFRDAVDALARKAELQYGAHGLRSSEVDTAGAGAADTDAVAGA
ncbi:CDP-glycerol glycerophosphotransferase, TagB/SpsB family [Jatrophihabitans endophyticus]|uniref:CDP-glycerol glycerophosphotransferase, TagB/SpsB family n=1 Tax=Jatrophihabitans endophyticus TaxID=1206085 RepID=A0A1M5GTG9_9ACTN|nr:CDP-glycerol glycerophosphotransferase family protein [Jatrophihabitans endophyticus]SHG07020.1 CDP-glycerol glycerophosphotransferase, TagB/SpsB family [Jatrophihabitans endophyticus]